MSGKKKEMPVLNVEPIEQTNGAKLDLHYGGGTDVLKMVVAPQFNYISVMLPIMILPHIFKQYEQLISDFLWEGKTSRIRHSKMCSKRNKGGLGLPDPRLYCTAF